MMYEYNSETCSFEKVKPQKNIGFIFEIGFIVIVLLMVLCTFIYHVGKLSGIKYIKGKTEIVTRITQDIAFNENALIELIKACNIKHPYIVLAQARLETGNYTSVLFKENHNLFGMKQARIRATTSEGTKNSYAYYKNWINSVYDYAMYQANSTCLTDTEKDYFTRLGDKYASDTNYVNSIKDIIKKYKLKKYFEE